MEKQDHPALQDYLVLRVKVEDLVRMDYLDHLVLLGLKENVDMMDPLEIGCVKLNLIILMQKTTSTSTMHHIFVYCVYRA